MYCWSRNLCCRRNLDWLWWCAQCDATPLDPLPESCNGVDDDCDDSIDEDPVDAGQGCSVGVELANDGVLTCDLDRRELVCNQEPSEATKEVCNAVDDDCDGIVGEKYPRRSMFHGQGRCLSESLCV